MVVGAATWAGVDDDGTGEEEEAPKLLFCDNVVKEGGDGAGSNGPSPVAESFLSSFLDAGGSERMMGRAWTDDEVGEGESWKGLKLYEYGEVGPGLWLEKLFMLPAERRRSEGS